MKLVSPGRFASLILAVFFLLGSAVEQEAMAQSRRNEAVLNRPFSNIGMPEDRGSWVWRDKKPAADPDGFEGFVAYVRPNAMPDKADITIRLYEAPAAGGNILILSETYNLVLDTTNEANHRRNLNPKNRTFHFVLTSPVCDADGKSLKNGKERVFFLREQGFDSERMGARIPTALFA